MGWVMWWQSSQSLMTRQSIQKWNQVRRLVSSGKNWQNRTTNITFIDPQKHLVYNIEMQNFVMVYCDIKTDDCLLVWLTWWLRREWQPIRMSLWGGELQNVTNIKNQLKGWCDGFQIFTISDNRRRNWDWELKERKVEWGSYTNDVEENQIIKMIKRSHAFVMKCHAQRHHMLVAENRHYLEIDLPTLERFRCVYGHQVRHGLHLHHVLWTAVCASAFYWWLKFRWWWEQLVTLKLMPGTAEPSLLCPDMDVCEFSIF